MLPKASKALKAGVNVHVHVLAIAIETSCVSTVYKTEMSIMIVMAQHKV